MSSEFCVYPLNEVSKCCGRWLLRIVLTSARRVVSASAIVSYAGRRPFCFTVVVYFFRFRRLISEVAWPIVTKLCRMFDMFMLLMLLF